MNRTTRTALLTRASTLAIATLCLAAPALAQTGPNDSKADTVVVTGVTTSTDQQKVGNSLTVVSGQMIEDEGYDYVSDVLRQVPGLAVNRGGAPGALTQVRIRGAEGNHTLALLDGFDISSPDQGETDFSTLMSGDIQRIEVLRGPQSGLYGSNALAGVINLITNKAVDGQYVKLDLEGGEEGTGQLQLTLGRGDGQNYISAGALGLTTSGYDVSADTSAQGVTTVGAGAQPGDKEGNSIGTFYVRGGLAATPVLHLDGFVNYINKQSDSDGQAFNFPIGGRTYDDDSHSATRRWLAAGSGTLTLLDGKFIATGRLSYLDERRRGYSTSFPFFAGPTLPANAAATLAAVPLSANGADATRAKGTLDGTYQFGGGDFVSYVTAFGEARQETFQNPYPSSPAQAPKQERNLVGVGAQYRAEIAQQVYLSGTVRHDDNDGDFEDANTYSVAASWVVPNIGTRPHASYGTGITNPTFFEQFGFNPGTFTGNPNLKPEEATGWDIGVEQSLMDKRLVVDVTYFNSKLKNEIFTAFGGAPLFLSTPANNTAKSKRNGWEVTLTANPIDDLDLTASYTNLDATEPAGIEVRRPKDQASFDGTWRIGGGPFKVALGVTYNGQQYDTDFGTFLRTKQDPYTLVRLGGSYELNEHVEFYARVENLTDEDYEEVIAFKGAPRAAFIGVRLRESTKK